MLQRFDYIRKAIEAETVASASCALALGAGASECRAASASIDAELAGAARGARRLRRLHPQGQRADRARQGGFERLLDIARARYMDVRGETQPYLAPDEVEALQVARGSLTESERLEIESHVLHTYKFLQQIPWGRTFRDVPRIAGAHHEKLDGTGYPRRLRGDDIPVAVASMMTIADIFDALTASDRPYKKAVPREKALDIIGFEVKKGALDPDLFRIFIEAKVYEIAHRGR